jgi:hypothetical protein
MNIEKAEIEAEREGRKLRQRVHELEMDLRRVRVVMRDAAVEACEISDLIKQGMTQRAAHYAGALQRKLDVERSSGPHVLS